MSGPASCSLASRCWSPVRSGRSGAAAPASAVTVDELVARALADNPELRAARAEVDAARGRLRQAGLRPNPMLDLAGQQNVAGPDNNVSSASPCRWISTGGRRAGSAWPSGSSR